MYPENRMKPPAARTGTGSWKYILPVFVCFLAACGQMKKPAGALVLVKTSHFPHYPSASSLAFFAGRLYVIGDDAPRMIVLDRDHNLVDSLPLFTINTNRIPKETKADLEASVIITRNDIRLLYAISSFSTRNRNRILCLSIEGGGKLQLVKNSTASFHVRDVGEMNIEGAAFIQNKLVLSNRANTTTGINYLLITEMGNDTIESKNVKIIPVTLAGVKKVAGISGLDYVPEKDLLLFSASTENTPNAYTDGAVGESYIGYIRDISRKLSAGTLTADTLIALSPYLQKKDPQKIESITVEEINGNELVIHLAADNDNGESTLYKMRWKL